MLWTLRTLAAFSVLGLTMVLAMTRPAPVGLEPDERAARAAAFYPGWSCPRPA